MSLFDNANSTTEKAYQKALNLLNFAPQTEKVLSQKLSKKGFKENDIETVIKRLKKSGLLNDIEFGSIYADNLAKIKCMGKNKIIMKLKLKGINDPDAKNMAEDAVNKNGGEEKIINEYIQKNALAIKRLLEKDKTERIKQKLYENGFSISNIQKIMKDIGDLI